MVYAVILAGGRGTRLDESTPKQLLPLGDISVIEWSILAFTGVKEVDRIIIVSEKSLLNRIDAIVKAKAYQKVFKIIEGGSERFESSQKALYSTNFSDDDILLFHDAARPFISDFIILNMIDALKECNASGVYINSTDTVAQSENGFISSVLKREVLRLAQTPQGFRYRTIKKAHDNIDKGFPTDDISLVINQGEKVVEVEGSPVNFKITDKLDYGIARYLAENNRLLNISD